MPLAQAGPVLIVDHMVNPTGPEDGLGAFNQIKVGGLRPEIRFAENLVTDLTETEF